MSPRTCWRGASVSNILGFGRDFPAPDGRTDAPAYPLTVNRRSDARILDVANRLAAPLYDAYPQARELRAKPDAATLAHACVLSADRAGLLYSGDLVGSLSLMLREDPTLGNVRLDSADAVRGAASARQDVRELMLFAVSDDFFRLRQKLKLGLA